MNRLDQALFVDQHELGYLVGLEAITDRTIFVKKDVNSQSLLAQILVNGFVVFLDIYGVKHHALFHVIFGNIGHDR